MFDTIPYSYRFLEFPVLSDTLSRSSLPVLDKLPVSAATSETMGILFIIFMLLFIFTAGIIGQQWKMLLATANGLWRSKSRQSIFYKATGNELYSKYLLFIQCLLLLAIFVCKNYMVKHPDISLSTIQIFSAIGILFVVFCLFYCIKWISYLLVGTVFFPQDKLRQWQSYLFSMIGLSAIILFLPVLFFVFIESIQLYCYYFILFYGLLFLLMIFYLSYKLFFTQGGALLYLFLYLCAQELIPLFFLYKSVVCLFNIL